MSGVKIVHYSIYCAFGLIFVLPKSHTDAIAYRPPILVGCYCAFKLSLGVL